MTPRMRAVEVLPVVMDSGLGFVIHDPSGLAAGSVTVSEPVLFLLEQFDGTHALDSIRDEFKSRFGRPISERELIGIIDCLSEARLLADAGFDQYFADLVATYREAPARVMQSAEELGLAENPAAVIADMLADSPVKSPPGGTIVGLVAPHLDYPRGRPCYSAAYSTLINRPPPRRVVILGTNHFGRSSSPVTTAKAFETPLGTTAADERFIAQLEARCGNLREHEFDHVREHSVELQLLICQHLWGADSFQLVPVLCNDPCGPTGAAPYDGCGPNLRDFAAALRECVEHDHEDTLIIAGADLSHVGAQFGDERVLDAPFKAEVDRRDRLALDHLAANAADAFVKEVARDDNSTRICSAGCIFATMSALPKARVDVLRYHQAVDEEGMVGVTCCAAVFSA
jgi:AmmeMemoRadiSam system protein B